jgi:peroxiredoxin (alkyl hydroperoxide reductase subunit C)
MTSNVRTPVPDLELEAYIASSSEPKRFRLADYRGSWVVLFFYPRDFTFICPTELQAFAELEEEFAAEDAVLVAVSTDSYWCHRAWFGTHPMLGEVRYPVVADTSHEMSAAYGALLEDGSALRATFVIDPEGVVRHATYSHQSVGRSPDETLRVLQALRTGELCPVNWRKGEPTLIAA